MAIDRAPLAIAMLAAATIPSAAQIRVPTDRLSGSGRDALQLDRAIPHTASVTRGARGQSQVPFPAFGDATGALSSFDLRFTGTDHKIRTIGTELQQGQVVFQLADREPDDNFTGSATWMRARYLKQATEIRAHGAGDFLVDIPAGPAGHVPLLAGFAFERRPGTDANVRLVAVQLIEGQNKVRVALVDDQGPDFRGMEQTIAASFGLSGFPFMGGVLAGAYTGGRMLQEFVNFDGKRLRTFHVRVQIVWAPRAAVLGTASVSGLSRLKADSGVMPAPADKVALKGFRFYFGNSDHHLKAIGVRLQAQGRSIPVLFQDNDTDDPIVWSADYARLR